MNIILYLTLIGLVFTAPIEKDAIENGYKAYPQSDSTRGLKKWPNGVVPFVFEGYS